MKGEKLISPDLERQLDIILENIDLEEFSISFSLLLTSLLLLLQEVVLVVVVGSATVADLHTDVDCRLEELLPLCNLGRSL